MSGYYTIFSFLNDWHVTSNAVVKDSVTCSWDLLKNSDSVLLVQGMQDASAPPRTIHVKDDLTIELRLAGRLATFPVFEKPKNFEDIRDILRTVPCLNVCGGTDGTGNCPQVFYIRKPHSPSDRCKDCQIRHKKEQMKMKNREARLTKKILNGSKTIKNLKETIRRRDKKSTTEEVEDIGSPYQLSEGSDHLTSKPECISDEGVQYTVSPSSARFLQKDSDNIENENVNTFEIEETESVEICRFCLKEITDGKNIFENYIDGDVPIYLAIRVCLYPIKVSFLDILSKYTCDECLNTLSSFVKFRALVMRNDKIQRNHLGKSAPLVSKEALSQKRSLLIENEPHVLKKIKIEPRPAQMCSISSSIQSKLTNQDVQKKDYSKVRTNSFGSSNQLKLTNQDRQNRNTSNENAETCQQVTKCIKTQLDNNETSPSTPILCSMAPVLQKKTDNKNQDGGTKPKIMILEENGKQSDSKVETSSCAQSPHDNIPFCMANGYLMEHKLLKGNLRYLKCASAKCPAVSTQKVLMPGVFESKVSIIKNHNHEKPTEIDIRKQKFISIIRRRLQTAKGTSIKSIYDEVCKLDPDSAKLVPMKELTKEICNL